MAVQVPRAVPLGMSHGRRGLNLEEPEPDDSTHLDSIGMRARLSDAQTLRTWNVHVQAMLVMDGVLVGFA